MYLAGSFFFLHTRKKTFFPSFRFLFLKQKHKITLTPFSVWKNSKRNSKESFLVEWMNEWMEEEGGWEGRGRARRKTNEVSFLCGGPTRTERIEC